VFQFEIRYFKKCSVHAGYEKLIKTFARYLEENRPIPGSRIWEDNIKVDRDTKVFLFVLDSTVYEQVPVISYCKHGNIILVSIEEHFSY
jgi:hypothetical protein